MKPSVSLLLVVSYLTLSDVTASCASHVDFRRRWHSPAASRAASPHAMGGAFVFVPLSVLLEGRRKSGDAGQAREQEPVALVVDKIDGDALVKIGTPELSGRAIGQGDGDSGYGFGGELNGGRQPFFIDVLDDESYAAMHPVERAYDKLSTLPLAVGPPALEPATLQDVSLNNGSLESVEVDKGRVHNEAQSGPLETAEEGIGGQRIGVINPLEAMEEGINGSFPLKAMEEGINASTPLKAVEEGINGSTPLEAMEATEEGINGSTPLETKEEAINGSTPLEAMEEGINGRTPLEATEARTDGSNSLKATEEMADGKLLESIEEGIGDDAISILQSGSLHSVDGGDDNVEYFSSTLTNLLAEEEGRGNNEEEGNITSLNVAVSSSSSSSTEDEAEAKAEAPESMWARRNARSIDEGIRFKSELREGDEGIRFKSELREGDEGIRFKSKLREGLEKQTKQHREQLLSNLLEGVIGGTSTALETVENEGESVRNGTNPFRWLGFGRDKESDAEDEGGDAAMRNRKRVGRNDVYEEINTLPPIHEEIGAKDLKRSFMARIITGLINGLAEEVEGLQVEVDVDAKTRMWDKSVPSIKIYFSRLGFRQLRMGGFEEDSADTEASIKLSERFVLASKFFNRGKPATAEEAFDSIDADGSGALDEEELAQALEMAAVLGGTRSRLSKFGARSKERLAELASRLVRLYDANGDGVVDREEYQAMVGDMASLRDARLSGREESESNDETRRGWLAFLLGGRAGDTAATADGPVTADDSATANRDGSNVADVIRDEKFWGSMDEGEGSIVLEDLRLDLRRLLYGAIPGVKRILPGGPLILKPFTATVTASFNKDDVMDSFLLDTGLRRLVARALSRRVRGLRDVLDGAVWYGRNWKLFEQNSPQVEVAKLEDVHFDKRNRLIITGRAKIKEALGLRHEPIEQGFKLRTKIGMRANGRIIGLLQPEIAIFAECPKDLERTVRTKCKNWFGYTIPKFEPLYTYIPLVSPLKKDDKMDGFNLGEDNRIKSIEIKNGKLRFEMEAFLRPGRFLGNHYLAFTVPNRTLILTLDRVLEGVRNARQNKRLAALAAREVQKLAAARDPATDDGDLGGPSICPQGRAEVRRLERELKATIQEEAVLREMEEEASEKEGKGFLGRFVEGYSGAIREELDLEMNTRLSSSISDFFGSQDRAVEDE